MFQCVWHQYMRSLGMAVIAVATLASHVSDLRGDTSKVSKQSWEVLRAVDAGLCGQESVDDEGSVLSVRIERPNAMRLEKLVKAFPSLDFVYFSGIDESLTPGDIQCLESLPHLKRLWFLSPLTDQWAEALSRFPQLRELHLLVRLGVTERGLFALSGFKDVETLSLGIGFERFLATEDEQGAAVLRQFGNLKVLTLSGASVSRQTLQEVGQHRQLKILRYEANHRNLENDDFAPLSQLQHLEEVEIPTLAVKSIAGLHSLKKVCGLSDINDEGMRHLSELRNLEELCLPGANRITDQSLIHLANATALTTLQLRSPKLDGRGLRHLTGCKQLRRLLLRQTNFQPQNVRHLTALSALEYLDLGWTPMNEGENWKTLAALKVLGNLKALEIELSEPDRLRLGDMLPGVFVNYLE